MKDKIMNVIGALVWCALWAGSVIMVLLHIGG